MKTLFVGPTSTLHLVFLGDGFTAAQEATFYAAADKIAQGVAKTRPFARLSAFLGAHAVFTPSAVSGVSKGGVVRQTPFMVQYDWGGVRRALGSAWTLPAEQLAAKALPGLRLQVVIIVNDTEYGGSGGRVVMVSRHGDAPKILAHELGHAAGLGDEYTTEIPYWPRFARPNLSLSPDPKAAPWSDLIGQPDGLGGTIGMVKGGGDHRDGIWRPTAKACLMGSLGKAPCAVCDRQIERWVRGL